METLKTFDEFMNEKKNIQVNEKALNLFKLTFESENSDFTLDINEGFVKDLQAHIRKTMDILIGEHGIKQNRIDKHLERNLSKLTASFQKGDSPEETAKKIA